MSSTYRLICLSHDPALALSEPERQSLEGALVAIGRAETWGHGGCDLIVSRYSYPLIEVTCPSQLGRKGGHGLHMNDVTIDVGWLRLLAHVRENDIDADALVGSAAMCWPPERLRLLEPLLDIEQTLASASQEADVSFSWSSSGRVRFSADLRPVRPRGWLEAL